MPKRRVSKRLKIRNNIRYGPTSPPKHISFITDLTDTGVCIKTINVFPPGTKLYMVFGTDDKKFTAEGVVVWSKKAPARLIRHTRSGMGVKFTDVDPELVALYRKKT